MNAFKFHCFRLYLLFCQIENALNKNEPTANILIKISNATIRLFPLLALTIKMSKASLGNALKYYLFYAVAFRSVAQRQQPRGFFNIDFLHQETFLPVG